MPEFILDTFGAEQVRRVLDTFTFAYIEAMFFCGIDTDDQGNDTADLGLVDLAPETLSKIQVDCTRFQTDQAALLREAGTPAQNGHDFWLTRNGHGAGFWDRGYPDRIGDGLTAAAKAFGETDACIGDDGKVYLS